MEEDTTTLLLVVGILAVLGGATAIGQFLKRHPDTGLNAAAVELFNQRLRAWWLMSSVLAAALWIGEGVTIFVFWFISFWALREFITLTPTRMGDHRALFWVFFLFTPLQYLLVALKSIRAVQHLSAGVCVPVHHGASRILGRLQAFFGADGEDPGRVVDLRV